MDMLNQRGQHGWRKCRGLTLTELIVSTAILAWMILVANQMLISSRNAIRAGEEAIRANAEARAAATRMRQDIEQVCPDGMMLITEIPPKTTPVPIPRRTALSFTAVGSYQSMVDQTIKSNLARIDYGLSLKPGESWSRQDDNGTPAVPSDDVYSGLLYRRAMLGLPGLGDSLVRDYESMCLAYYRIFVMAPGANFDAWAASDISPLWSHSYHPEGAKNLAHLSNPMWEGGTSAVASINLPITNLVDLDNLWPYMLEGVSYLNFQWTDGSTNASGDLLWYGYAKDAGGADVLRARDGNWRNVAPMSELMGTPVVEFARNIDAVGFTKAYCAFWSYKHRELWPKALKVQFKVGNPPRPYEIVVALPTSQ